MVESAGGLLLLRQRRPPRSPRVPYTTHFRSDPEAEAEEPLTEPEDIAAAILGHLKAALEEIETLSEELEPDSVDEAATVGEVAE